MRLGKLFTALSIDQRGNYISYETFANEHEVDCICANSLCSIIRQEVFPATGSAADRPSGIDAWNGNGVFEIKLPAKFSSKLCSGKYRNDTSRYPALLPLIADHANAHISAFVTRTRQHFDRLSEASRTRLLYGALHRMFLFFVLGFDFQLNRCLIMASIARGLSMKTCIENRQRASWSVGRIVPDNDLSKGELS